MSLGGINLSDLARSPEFAFTDVSGALDTVTRASAQLVAAMAQMRYQSHRPGSDLASVVSDLTMILPLLSSIEYRIEVERRSLHENVLHTVEARLRSTDPT